MLEKLGEVLKKTTDKIANAIFLDKNLVDSIVKDLQRALIEADVNVALVKEISDEIRRAALDERIKGLEKKEHMIKLLHDRLTGILGEYRPLTLAKGNNEQNRIMFLGLYGAGKTTTIAKIGNYFAKRGQRVVLVGLDVHRPAAAEQLKQLADKNKIPCIIDPNEKNPVRILKKYDKELKEYNVVLLDTAGRHTLDKDLIEEIKQISKQVSPTETILVMPADIGQAAKKQAKEFQDAVSISGVIITRMDSTARGGGALTACAETRAPVYFITTGEKINDIEEFNPKSFLSRLLGMGDLETLMEKIKSISGLDSEEKMKSKLAEGKLSLEDVIEQVKSMNSLGGFEKIKGMIPGFGSAKVPEGVLENQQAKVAKWEHIVKSMTPAERENPELLEKQTQRIGRVAQGAGVNNSDVRALLKQYKLLNEMVKGGLGSDSDTGAMSPQQMQKMMKKFAKVKKIRF
ncbi:signal recognition particle receptor subunit alpha [Patescibacteria group bacterium]|nr:signal recognition particle receptor subunit alpha [Patescibacteria group bacterium]